MSWIRLHKDEPEYSLSRWAIIRWSCYPIVGIGILRFPSWLGITASDGCTDGARGLANREPQLSLVATTKDLTDRALLGSRIFSILLVFNMLGNRVQ